MAWEELDRELIKKLLKQVSGKLEAEDGVPELPALILGNGYRFYYSPVKKTFVKIESGVLIYIISHEMDDKGRVLAYFDGILFAIEPKDFKYMGFD